MNLARRIRFAVAAAIAAPLLAACTFTGDVELTQDSQFMVDLLVTDSQDVCNQDLAQSILQGLTIEKQEQVGQCRITGTAGTGLAAVLGIAVAHDESGYRLTTSEGMAWWNPNSADIAVRLPGPITEVEGAEQSGPNEVRVNYNGYGEIPRIVIASRAGYGPSKVEWAAGIGLVSGVGLTLLFFGIRRWRRNRLLAAELAGWPPPDDFATPADAPAAAGPADDAFWSGAAQPRPPVVGERSRRQGDDPSVWAPPPG
jgi:hypothetical protein